MAGSVQKDLGNDPEKKAAALFDAAALLFHLKSRRQVEFTLSYPFSPSLSVTFFYEIKGRLRVLSIYLRSRGKYMICSSILVSDWPYISRYKRVSYFIGVPGLPGCPVRSSGNSAGASPASPRIPEWRFQDLRSGSCRCTGRPSWKTWGWWKPGRWQRRR